MKSSMGTIIHQPAARMGACGYFARFQCELAQALPVPVFLSSLCQVPTDHPDIGALLLECSDMPPYAKEIQDATGRPVWDFVTLIDWIHSSVVRRSFDGFI